MIEGGRHSNLQVFEENYNEETNETTARRIFKGGRAAENQKAPGRAAGRAASATPRGGADKEIFQKERRTARPKKRTSIAVPVIVLSVIVAIGMAALIGLRYFT